MKIRDIVLVYSHSWIIFLFEGIFRHNFGMNHCEYVYIGRSTGTSGLVLFECDGCKSMTWTASLLSCLDPVNGSVVLYYVLANEKSPIKEQSWALSKHSQDFLLMFTVCYIQSLPVIRWHTGPFNMGK